MPRFGAPNITYRNFADDTENPAQGQDPQATSSTGHHRGALAELLSTPAERRISMSSPISGALLTSSPEVKPSTVPSVGTFMTLPPHRGRPRRRGMDQIAWFSSVKVDREKSITLPGEGGNSNVSSRMPSRVRAMTTNSQRTRTRSRSLDPPRSELDFPEDLADE